MKANKDTGFAIKRLNNMKNLYVKLHAFQAEVGTIKKSEVNPFFKSRYVDINGIIEAIKPLLEKHGLVIMQPLALYEGKSALTTIIADIESGDSLNISTPLPEMSDPQKMGSAITYFRRYALQSLLLLEAEDDDGNGASQTQNSVSRTSFPTKNIQTTTNDENPPVEAYDEAEAMARIMDGEVVSKQGAPVPIINKFPDCPHDNLKNSAYRKCYSCNLKRENNPK